MPPDHSTFPSHGRAPRMTAVLFVQRFRLQAVLLKTDAETQSSGPEQTSPSFFNTAVGLVEGGTTKGLLLEASPQAESFGVHAGMPSAQALARCPELLLVTPSALREQQLAQRLLSFAGSLSPRVEKQADNRYLLDLKGLQVEDWESWAQEAVGRLSLELGLSGVLGVAPRPGLAWCAARRAFPVKVVHEPESFVEELTFAELAVSENLQQQLADWGIRTLGQLLRLPKQEARERLGPEATPLWELARDTRESVLRLESFPDPLELGQDFEHPVETLEPVLFVLNRQIEQLASRMRLLHRVASTLFLKLTLENAAPYERLFSLPAPSREEAILMRVMETHLETLTLTSPLLGVRLKIQETLPTSQQLALFETPLRDPHRFGETLARLHALAGENRVGVPRRADTHRPGLFHLLDPVQVFAAPTSQRRALVPDAAPAQAALRGIPMRRFRPALAATVWLKQHRPERVQTSHLSGPVLDCGGPYRLSGEWWEEKAWRIEEWDVELGGTAHGLYRLACDHGPPKVWSLEGCYDGERWPETR